MNATDRGPLFAWTCPGCRRVVPMRAEEFPVHCSCGYVGAIDELGVDVPIVGRAVKFAAAIAKWVRAGRPVRPAGEVAQIFREKCQPCSHFRPADKACALCGCHVNASRKALKNKIAMKTEACPIGEW